MRGAYHDPEALLGSDNLNSGTGHFYRGTDTRGEQLIQKLQAEQGAAGGQEGGGVPLGMVGLGATVLFGMASLLL